MIYDRTVTFLSTRRTSRKLPRLDRKHVNPSFVFRDELAVTLNGILAHTQNNRTQAPDRGRLISESHAC